MPRKYRVHIRPRFFVLVIFFASLGVMTALYALRHAESTGPEPAEMTTAPTSLGSVPLQDDLTGPSARRLAVEFGLLAAGGAGRPTVSEPYTGLLDPRVTVGIGDAGSLGPPPPRRQVDVKGIYLTGYTAGNSRSLAPLINLVKTTELNTMVINVKDDDGRVTYESSLPAVQRIHAATNQIPDIKGLLETLHSDGIYVIARIVTFKDPPLANAHPEWSVQSKSGGLWRDWHGLAWVDPSNPNVWQYNIDLAREAYQLGFDEIQFDYVRFPTDGPVDLAVFPGMDGHDKAYVISSFLQQVRRVLGPTGIPISADVFGLTTAAADDMRIGQHLEDVARYVDYVSPMVYPSHYGPYNYGIPDPDAEPYQTVLHGVGDGIKRLRFLTCQVRPWLQDFSLRHAYGPDQVRAQIEASYQAGAQEWLLWNAANHYTEAALQPKQALSPQAAGTGP